MQTRSIVFEGKKATMDKLPKVPMLHALRIIIEDDRTTIIMVGEEADLEAAEKLFVSAYGGTWQRVKGWFGF